MVRFLSCGFGCKGSGVRHLYALLSTLVLLTMRCDHSFAHQTTGEMVGVVGPGGGDRCVHGSMPAKWVFEIVVKSSVCPAVVCMQTYSPEFLINASID